ncbi:valine--pyruvate transaminase [Legionella massiliensis]|uniref:Valine--pyruvate transaminase n=1 Tax=Legionella massiliensis TaxID=1034943 RepID=A0A078KUG0_9GAMM|nr:aminotransferase class I/II-fold pyridoxal phosphate-dependent enzyme [Legionella massiliensis]CDZ76637.1 valine--pyruvate transaminase [Legionella massiliensis]CEE12375.1 valine--pyruvate transaminase [Legionella massiliensis]
MYKKNTLNPIINLDQPVSRFDLERKFKVLWDDFNITEDEPHELLGIEAAGANPYGRPPMFAVEQANEYLMKHPSSLTRYEDCNGLKFIRKELVATVKSIGYKTSDDKLLTEENIAIAPGINSSINTIYKYLRDKSLREQPDKTPCIITNNYFYTIPDISNVKFLSANSEILIHDGVHPKEINDAIEKARKLNMNPILYYNVTPDNPTGTITSKERALELSNIFRMPENSKIFVLNDLAYHFTYLNNGEKTYPIGGAGFQSAMMFGLSKIAGPGFRVSSIVSDREFIKSLEISSFSEFMFPSIHSQLVLYFFFKKSNDKLRNHFLEEKRKHLNFNSKLMLVLINGLNSVKDLKTSELKKIHELLEKKRVNNYKNLIKHGLNGISIINNPKAAFFHIIDFTSFRGQFFLNKEIMTGIDLAEVFYRISKSLLFPLDMLSLGNSNALLKKSTLLMRVSYSTSTSEIIDLFLNIKMLQDNLK